MENWESVADAIDQRVESVWQEEPESVRRLRLGVVPSDAGTFGQYYSTLVFALIYTLTLGEHVCYGLVKGADSSDTTLDSLKSLTRDHLASGFQAPLFLGYVLEPEIHEFGQRIDATLEAVSTKGELRRLLGAYQTYLNILHWWLHVIFPWHLGALFPRVTPERLHEIESLVSHSQPVQERYRS